MPDDRRPQDGAVPERIRMLVEERLGIDVPDVGTDLIEAGLLDSLALVTLIVALEDEFAVALPLDDFDVDRFRSVDAMSAFLAAAGAVEPGSAA
jgi:D-alanine--poly(phosphoribitol) ligase subunit 2